MNAIDSQPQFVQMSHYLIKYALDFGAKGGPGEVCGRWTLRDGSFRNWHSEECGQTDFLAQGPPLGRGMDTRKGGLSPFHGSSESPTWVHMSASPGCIRVSWTTCSFCRFWGLGPRESDSIDVAQDSRTSTQPTSRMSLMEAGP